MLYRTKGTTVATAATADHAIAAIWNPHSTKRIKLVEFSIFAITAPAASAGFYFRRITARGTPGSTVTPGLEGSDQRDLIPPSGWLLDLAAYSAQPTLATAPGIGPSFVFAAVAASGIVLPMRSIEIPPGTGLAAVNRAAIAVVACDVGIIVED
jgi:hypothetical protein